MVTDKGKIVADKDKQIAWLSQSCDALADEVRRLEAQVYVESTKRAMDGK